MNAGGGFLWMKELGQRSTKVLRQHCKRGAENEFPTHFPRIRRKRQKPI
jgi:hypothetical protein